MDNNKLLDQLMAVPESGKLNAIASDSELLEQPLDRLDGHLDNREIDWERLGSFPSLFSITAWGRRSWCVL